MKRSAFFLMVLLLIALTALNGFAETSVMQQARTAEGFYFTGENAAESNPENRMAHNIYMDPDLSGTSGKFRAYCVNFLAEDMAQCTYWSLCNWSMDVSSLAEQYTIIDAGAAYAGLQMTPEGNKGIMSFWEIHYLKDGADAILRATRIYPEGNESYFAGEGEGTNYAGLYPWEKDHWYRMVVSCRDDESGNTIVDQMIVDLETGEWTLLSSFDTGLQHSCLVGAMYMFMENYAWEYSNEFRSFRLRNIWAQEYDSGEWKPVTGATLSTDTWWDNKKGSFAFGADNLSLWGMTCGYGTDIVKTHPDVRTDAYFPVPSGDIQY